MMSARTRLGLEILVTGLVLGLLGDTLLRAMPWGLNVTLCAAALTGGGLILVRRHHLSAGPDTPWLAITVLLLGAAFTRRDAAALAAFDVVAMILALALAAASLRGERIAALRPLDYLQTGVTTAVSTIAGGLLLVGQDVQWNELPREGRLKHVRAIALGALLAAPLLVVFGALFASADQVFGNALANLFKVDAENLLSHTFQITFWGAVTAGYLRWVLLARNSVPARFLPADRPEGTLGIVPVATALGLVTLLFLIFVVVQLRYFFGGANLVEVTTGLTYAEYARRGFFELCTASGLVLPVLLGADHLVRAAPPAHMRVFRQLSGLLLVLLAVVMASALQRMRLYVQAFGLSESRLYATAFMVYLFAVFGWLAATVLRGASGEGGVRRGRFAFGALIQGFTVLAGLHLLNPDALIVRTNLQRTVTERPFDAKYATSLGADAVPPLLDALPSLGGPERCAVASVLLTRWGKHDADWRTWNWSRARARRLVTEQADALRSLPCPPIGVTRDN